MPRLLFVGAPIPVVLDRAEDGAPTIEPIERSVTRLWERRLAAIQAGLAEDLTANNANLRE